MSNYRSANLWTSIAILTLINKKTKFSSIIRKSRRERLQSHIWLTASSYMTKYLPISSYIRKPFLMYDFATAPIWISLLYEGNIIFFFMTNDKKLNFRLVLRQKLVFYLMQKDKSLWATTGQHSCGPVQYIALLMTVLTMPRTTPQLPLSPLRVGHRMAEGIVHIAGDLPN